MSTVHFDFTQAATRQAIIDQLTEFLGADAFAQVAQKANEAGVPQHHHHGIVEVRQTIDSLAVTDQVKQDLSQVYEILAAAEAQVHECEVDHTHFHEVGNGSAILNSLIICMAFDQLGADRITATPIQTGSGQIECAHGLMDVPAPATAAIIETGIPVCAQKLEGELCTPTSAAIIKHFVDEFIA